MHQLMSLSHQSQCVKVHRYRCPIVVHYEPRRWYVVTVMIKFTANAKSSQLYANKTGTACLHQSCSYLQANALITIIAITSNLIILIIYK